MTFSELSTPKQREAAQLPQLPEAACMDLPVELFFPPSGEHGLDAKAVCADCPERLPCLQWAMQTREPYGVFGGLTASERHRLRAGSGPGRPRGVFETGPRSR